MHRLINPELIPGSDFFASPRPAELKIRERRHDEAVIARLETLLEIEEATEQRFQRFIDKRAITMAVGKATLFATLLGTATAAPYLGDVRVNMIATAEAKPSVTRILPAPDPLDTSHASIFSHGFNTFGAKHLVKTLGPGYQDAFGGEAWSIEYNNAILDSAEISEITKQRLDTNEIETVDFTSYSMGNDPIMDVAVDTVANTWVDVENITIISGPADFSTLTKKTQDELAIAKNLSWIPWIEYSTPFRYGLEAYFYRDHIEKNPLNAFGGINTRFQNGNVTTNAFLASQINSVSKLDVPAKVEELGKHADTKHMPNINVIKIANGMDTVVDNDASAEKICAAAIKAKLNCTILEVNSRHGLYYLPSSIEEYNEVFEQLADIVKPYTTKEAARHAINLYGYYQLDTYVP